MTAPTTWSPADHPALPDITPTPPAVEAIGHLVVVPRMAGPLIDVDAAAASRVDDLDAAIDEFFGETTDEPAGPLDAALVLGGLGLVGWSVIAGAPAPVLIAGVCSTLLGIALPARAVATGSRERRRASSRERAVADGLPLDASDPTVRALVDAYQVCWAAAAKPVVPGASDASEAAHLAVVEVASLLGGGRPMAEAEVEYVRARTKAIGRLTLRLERAQRMRIEWRLESAIHHPSTTTSRTPTDRGWATARTEARVELESATGLSSLDRLDAVGTRIEREAHDARR
jgi:hypothetical protein